MDTRALLTVAGFASLFAFSCAKPPPPKNPHPEPLSVAEHIAEAKRHEAEAARQQAMYVPNPAERGRTLKCFEQVNPVPAPDDGGERIPLLRPCWTTPANPTAIHLEEAQENRREADEHRARAAALIGAEKRSCQGLGESAVAHSPFIHREDIVLAEPVHEKDELRGARVLFRKVPGLTSDWLEKVGSCHQARAAVMGFSATFMPSDPLSVRDANLSVKTIEQGVWVTVTSERAESAALIWARVRGLVYGEEPETEPEAAVH